MSIPSGLPASLHSQLQSAQACVDLSPPPSLQDILQAYKAKGDGDREMLLAMLGAKTAEDQRIANMATLRRTMLDIYRQTSNVLQPIASLDLPLYEQGSYGHYSKPTSSQSPPPRREVDNYKSQLHSYAKGARAAYLDDDSRSASPPYYTRAHQSSRKRARASVSPYSHTPIDDRQTAHLPPSPHSSHSSHYDPDYSPRLKSSMAINSLLQDRRRSSFDESVRSEASSHRKS